MPLLRDGELERLAKKVDVLYGTMANFDNVMYNTVNYLNFQQPVRVARYYDPATPATLDDVLGYDVWPKRYQDLWLKEGLRYAERFELILFLEGNGKNMKLYLPWLVHFGGLNWQADRLSIMGIIDDVKNQNHDRPTWRFFSLHRKLWCYVKDGTIVPNVNDRLIN